MAANQETLYIKGDRDVEVTNPDVKLGDIVSMECSNKDIIPKVKALRLIKIPPQGEHRCVVSVLKIIACIHEQYPGIDVQNLGETDIIITYEEQKNKGKVFHIVKTAVVSALVFIGAAFSIMTFNNDVDVPDLFSQVYEFATGTKSDGFTVLEVSYSVGITLGILTFFNHIGKKRFTVDPTPLEVQMRTYENEIQTALIETASRKGEELDVGKTNPSGNLRS